MTNSVALESGPNVVAGGDVERDCVVGALIETDGDTVPNASVGGAVKGQDELGRTKKQKDNSETSSPVFTYKCMQTIVSLFP